MLKVKFINEGIENFVDSWVDSDFDSEDEKEITTKRILNKRDRHYQRTKIEVSKASDKEENKIFATQFKKFLMTAGSHKERVPSGINKHFNFIIYWPDSLCQYETDQNPNFNLLSLLSFDSDNFCSLKYPLDWIEATGGKASRKSEKLKSHSALRKFILYKLSNYAAGSLEALQKKALIKENLNSIEEEITRLKLGSKYTAEEANEKSEVDKAQMVLDPNFTNKIIEAVAKWNNSAKKEEIEREMIQIYDETMKTRKIKKMSFNKFCNYVKFYNCITDKSRMGSYNYKNKDVASMLRIYFPDGYTSFEELPPNWNVNQPGYEGQTPSAYVIKVVPDSQIILKKKKTVDVILTPNVKSWIDKLRDIKEVHFEEISPEKEFFVNFENVPLKDQTSRRSVWYEFTQITGVTKMNLTKVR